MVTHLDDATDSKARIEPFDFQLERLGLDGDEVAQVFKQKLQHPRHVDLGQILPFNWLETLPRLFLQVSVLLLVCLLVLQVNVKHTDKLLLFIKILRNIVERLEHSHRHVVIHGPYILILGARFLVHYRIGDVIDRK